MLGFFVANRKVDITLSGVFPEHCVCGTIPNARYTIARSTLDKFLDDKLFSEDEDCIFLTDGVILNKKQLCKESGKDWFHTVKNMMLAESERYFDHFRGSFSGAHYDKATDTWIIYTNHTGEKPIFYCSKEGFFAISSSVESIVEALKSLNIAYTPDMDAVYDMLTYGFMASGRTYVQEIKRLPYGCYLRMSGNELTIHRYYDFDYAPESNELSDDEIVEEIDKRFREAVRAHFEKDLEYGYHHLATLSGGLDSRMVIWVAHELGYRDMLSITFGQSECTDIKCAQKVANALGTELLIRTLDDGSFLKDYRRIIQMNDGLVIYSGICHTDSIMRYLNYANLGILHTGDVGDAIIGTFLHKGEHGKTPGAYSEQLVEHVCDVWDGKENLEKFKMRTRVFQGVGASMYATGHYTETMSPFLYRDFFDYCLTQIPESKRAGHYIYKKWILKKYPDAAKFPSDRYYGGCLTEGKTLQMLRKIHEKGAYACMDYALVKLHLKKERDWRITRNSMNPFDKWYEENTEIRDDLDGYYAENMRRLQESNLFDETLMANIGKMYENEKSTCIEKLQVITALGALERYFK